MTPDDLSSTHRAFSIIASFRRFEIILGDSGISFIPTIVFCSAISFNPALCLTDCAVPVIHYPPVRIIMSDRPTTPSDSKSNGKTQTVFIHKLYDMLHDQSISHLIWWSPTNDSFYLLPGEEFSKVLSQYFKHTNIASFIRQLNMYGFHKVNDTFTTTVINEDEKKAPPTSSSPSSQTSSPARWEFRHSTNQFRKGDVDSLKLIKRRSSKNINSHKEIVNLNSIPPTSNSSMMDRGYVFQQKPQTQHPQPPPQGPPQNPATSQTQLLQPHRLSEDYHDTNNLSRPSPASSTYTPTSPTHHSNPPEFAIRPPLMTNPSFEHSIHVRFIELNNQIFNLKTELVSTHNVLMSEIKRNQSDMIHILEAFEKYIHHSTKPTPNTTSTTSSTLPTDTPDRLGNNKTPTNRSTNDTDYDQSPMSKPPVNTNPNTSYLSNSVSTAAIAKSIENEIKSLKFQLLSRLDSPQQPPPVSNTYHLGDNTSRHPSNSNIQIVPQNYPVNPNYTIYSQAPPNGIAFRNIKMQQTQSQTQEHRQSVHIPPLQPVPSRKNSTVLLNDHNQHGNFVPTNFPRIDTKSHSPCTVAGGSQQPIIPSMPGETLPKSVSPHSQLGSNAEKDRPLFQLQTIKSYSQYPFPNMTNDRPAPPSGPSKGSSFSSSSRQPSSRTNSLPIPIIDHSVPTPIQHELNNVPTANYYHQRNSFTSIYDQRRLRLSPHTTVQFPYSPGKHQPPQQTIPPFQKLQPANKSALLSTLLTITSARTSSPSSSTNGGLQRLPSPLSTSLPRSIPNPSTTPKPDKPGKPHLPLVNELENPQKLPPCNYSPMTMLLNKLDNQVEVKKEGYDLESSSKKRKITNSSTITET